MGVHKSLVADEDQLLLPRFPRGGMLAVARHRLPEEPMLPRSRTPAGLAGAGPDAGGESSSVRRTSAARRLPA